ncbi:hypothetical protein FRUB_10165 [Fimbriiglobus ruber]|uniref:Uncharacterized protein n=1 Tax=Fimbriiglobus ruber TaxID=1908690 RepID=A0A225D3L1_9BACT|nr:hypothetical protein FRUB_10165 [Fimbriiglobus ruber]
MTPKGVEHKQPEKSEEIGRYCVMNAVTPKGVEHPGSRSSTTTYAP